MGVVKSTSTSGGFLVRLRGAEQLTQWEVAELSLVHSLTNSNVSVTSTGVEARGAGAVDVRPPDDNESPSTEAPIIDGEDPDSEDSDSDDSESEDPTTKDVEDE